MTSIGDGTEVLAYGRSREQFVTEEWFQLELAFAFRPRWQFAGHIDELPDQDAYLT